MARCFVDGRRRFPAPRMSSDSESFRRFVGLRLTRTSFDQRTLLDRIKSSRGHHDSRRVRGTLLAHSAVGPPDLRGVQRKRSETATAADLGRRSHGRGPVDYLQRHPSPPWPSNDRSGTKNGDDRFRRIQTFSLRQVGERCYPRPEPDWVRKARFIAADLRREDVMGKTRCAEPSLDELFGDIAVQLLMRRDGVRESDIRALLGQVKQAWAATSAETASKRAGRSPSNHNPSNLSCSRSALCS